jgi:integrase
MRRNPTQKQAFPLIDNSDPTQKQGSIIRKPGSKKLYILFTYHGRRVEKTTGRDDTPENREKVRTWLDGVIRDRNAGRLVFSDAFPGASETEKAIYCKLEGHDYSPDPWNIPIDNFITTWESEVVSLYDHTKQGDYLAILKACIKPYFADKTFYDLTKLEVKKFLTGMNCKIGKNKGKRVSRSRAKNVLTVLRALFEDACDHYHWELPDPFTKVEDNLPKKKAEKRQIFRFSEWIQVLEKIDPWYRPMVEFMMLTGTIHSEISGLRRSDIGPDKIQLEQSIVRMVEKKSLKETARFRSITITKRIRTILDEILARVESNWAFAEPDGSPYLREGFIESYWRPALKRAKVFYRPPYSLRHSFAAWCLVAGVDPLRLVNLMGHANKQMVFETYGNYLEGVDEDYEEILNYLGRDFVEYKKKPLSSYKALSGESPCESQGLMPRN